MSALTIAPCFPFRRIKIINQQVFPDASETRIFTQPDLNAFNPFVNVAAKKLPAFTAGHSARFAI